MNCPHCSSCSTTLLSRRTSLGYKVFRCRQCRRVFNERTATPFNHLQFPTDIVLLVVVWRLRYKLSLRDLAEMFLERGFEFTHETVRDWESRFAPLITDYHRTDPLQAQRKGRSFVVRRRNLCESRGQMVLPLPCSRPGWQSGRLHAIGEARYGRGQAVLHAGQGCSWPWTDQGDHRRPRLLPACDMPDTGP